MMLLNIQSHPAPMLPIITLYNRFFIISEYVLSVFCFKFSVAFVCVINFFILYYDFVTSSLQSINIHTLKSALVLSYDFAAC